MSPRQPKLVSAGVWTSWLWVRRGAESRHKQMSWRKVGCNESCDGKEEWRGADKACEAEGEIRGEVRG